MTFSRNFRTRPDETIRQAASDATQLTGLSDEHLVLYEAGITMAEAQAELLPVPRLGYHVAISGWMPADERGGSGVSVNVAPTLA